MNSKPIFKQSYVVDVPFFIENEKRAFASVLNDPNFNRYGKYCLTIENVTSKNFDAEKVASAYLLMNALLMTRAKSKIVKMICLQTAELGEVYSVINALRSMFSSEFSSLENVALWVKILEQDFKLSTPVLFDIESTVRFLEDSEIARHSTSIGKAEVFFGISDTNVNDFNGGQFCLTSTSLFHSQISSVSTEYDFNFNEIYMGNQNIYKTGDQGLNSLVQISQNELELSIAEWMTEIDPFLDREFYKAK